MNPYPPWLNAGDNAWQLVAATLVGLMSIPGIAILYGGIVQRKWAVNTMLMAFTGFSLVLVVWVLWVFKMGFGTPLKLGPGIFSNFVGHPGPILGRATQDQAQIPLLNGLMPQFRFPGLRPGDRWCVTAANWLRAHHAGVAAPVVLASTHERALEIIPMAALQEHAVDVPADPSSLGDV